MPRAWVKEQPSHWDADKERIIGAEPDGTFPLKNPNPGELMPGEWWRVEQDGKTVGYGRLDVSWGDGQVLVAVGRNHRGEGLGAYILDRLQEEAAERGLHRIYNRIRKKHPEREWIGDWLRAQGFERDDDDTLRRAVR